MPETILSSPFFIEMILPFLLVFTLIFAILDKTKILGEGKRQINAIISFVVGLIFISFASAVGLTIQLMGFMAIVAVVLLVFLLLYAFVASDKDGKFKLHGGVKAVIIIAVVIALIIALLVFTGNWESVANSISEGSGIATNLIFIVIIIAAVAVVLIPWGKSGGGKEKEE